MVWFFYLLQIVNIGCICLATTVYLLCYAGFSHFFNTALCFKFICSRLPPFLFGSAISIGQGPFS